MSMEPFSIFIIDDNGVDRYLLERIIEESGYKPTIYEYGYAYEALDFFKKKLQGDDGDSSMIFPPSLILLDINLPIMNGFGFLDGFTVLLNEFPGLKIPVVTLLTSAQYLSDIEKSNSYECVLEYAIKMPTAEYFSNLFSRIVG